MGLFLGFEMAKKILAIAAPMVPSEPDPLVDGACKYAVMTRPELLPEEQKAALEPLLGKYWD